MKPFQENLKTIKYLTQEEVARLFTKIKDKRDRAMFNVVYKYGLRASEVGLLKIDDIDLDRRRVKIYRLKGGLSSSRALCMSWGVVFLIIVFSLCNVVGSLKCDYCIFIQYRACRASPHSQFSLTHWSKMSFGLARSVWLDSICRQMPDIGDIRQSCRLSPALIMRGPSYV